MRSDESWQRFEEAARAALAGHGNAARAYLAAIRKRCGEAVATQQEKELRAYIAHQRNGKFKGRRS